MTEDVSFEGLSMRLSRIMPSSQTLEPIVDATPIVLVPGNNVVSTTFSMQDVRERVDSLQGMYVYNMLLLVSGMPSVGSGNTLIIT